MNIKSVIGAILGGYFSVNYLTEMRMI